MKLSSLTALIVGALALFLAFFGSPGEARAHPESQVMACTMATLDHKPFTGTKAERLHKARHLQPGEDLWINGAWMDLPKGSNPYRLCASNSSEQLAASTKALADMKALAYDPEGRTWQSRAANAETRLKKANEATFFYQGSGKNLKKVYYRDLAAAQAAKLKRAAGTDWLQTFIIAILVIMLVAGALAAFFFLRQRKQVEDSPEQQLVEILREDDENADWVLSKLRTGLPHGELLRQYYAKRAEEADLGPSPRPRGDTDDAPLFGDERRQDERP
jgi:hypothetical protein